LWGLPVEDDVVDETPRGLIQRELGAVALAPKGNVLVQKLPRDSSYPKVGATTLGQRVELRDDAECLASHELLRRLEASLVEGLAEKSCRRPLGLLPQNDDLEAPTVLVSAVDGSRGAPQAESGPECNSNEKRSYLQTKPPPLGLSYNTGKSGEATENYSIK